MDLDGPEWTAVADGTRYLVEGINDDDDRSGVGVRQSCIGHLTGLF